MLNILSLSYDSFVFGNILAFNSQKSFTQKKEGGRLDSILFLGVFTFCEVSEILRLRLRLLLQFQFLQRMCQSLEQG